MPVPYPSDGTYICTQIEPPPEIQFQVTIAGDTMTRDDGSTWRWDTEHSSGAWKLDSEEEVRWLLFNAPNPPALPDPTWIEVDQTNHPPSTYYRGTW